MKSILKGLFVLLMTIILTTGCKNNSLDVNNTKTITFKNLSAEIPSAFEKDNENSSEDFIQFEFSTDDNSNTCMMRFSKMEGYPSSDLKNTVYEGLLNRDDIEYSSKTINGITWTTGYYTEGVKLIAHSYATNYNNTLYEFEFEDFGNGDLCNQAFEKIANSLKLK